MKFQRDAEKLYSKLEEQEIDGVKHYYKKREVFPIFNRDGSFHWKNLIIGNWKGLVIVIWIVLITLGVFYEYSTNLKTGADCLLRENLIKNLSNFQIP